MQLKNIPSTLIVFISLLLFSCNQSAKKVSADDTDTLRNQTAQQIPVSGYDLDHPQKKWQLPPALLEISGNTWIDKDHLLVIEDLHPNLYLLNLKDSAAVIEKTIPFKEDIAGKKIDIEDVALVNNTAYALWSHGTVYKITDWQNKLQVKEVETFLSKINNTEGLCFDPVSQNLLIACKEDAAEEAEKKSTRAIYQYNIAGDSLLTKPFMLIHKKDFKELTGEKESFYPSAIAVHPITHDIYILSSKETKCMAVFTHDGVLKNFQLINKDLLIQPEGMCFSPDGILYISTEGKLGGAGYIYQFTMQR
ncbi:MAG: SdiA-regulated domain-containing protein [Ferruginibacter sp.]